MKSQDVTVVIATSGSPHRATRLGQAIESLTDQQDANAVPLVVLNGDQYDRKLRSELENRSDIRFHYDPQPSLPNAIHVGRKLVDTPYFGYLDDDDLYLPHAIERRLACFERDDSVDAVVSNGHRQLEDGSSVEYLDDINQIERDPLLYLMKYNWLASCGGLFKTETIDPEYFENLHKYFEWTGVAFRIAFDKKLSFLEEPTFVVNFSPNSLSDSADIAEYGYAFLQELMSMPMSAPIKRQINTKMMTTKHDLSEFHRQNKNFAAAWKFHLGSLLHSSGWRYLTYTRYLIFR